MDKGQKVDGQKVNGILAAVLSSRFPRRPAPPLARPGWTPPGTNTTPPAPGKTAAADPAEWR